MNHERYRQDIMEAVRTGEEQFNWRLGSLRQKQELAIPSLIELPIGVEHFSPTKSIAIFSGLLLSMAAIALMINPDVEALLLKFL